MTLKIKIVLLLYLIISLLSGAIAQEPGGVSITDINWEAKENLLTYNLSQDSRVKIRVGLYSGPVYRTIVNLEGRARGKQQERWDGKDEEGKIDFLKYGKPHFCVDVPVKPGIDSVLNVKFSNSENSIKGPLTIDVQEELKSVFAKNGAELKVYLDNKLRKIERVNSLPYTFSLKIDDVPEGKYLMAINLWQELDFSAVAYKSFEVFVSKEKSQTPVKATVPSKGRITPTPESPAIHRGDEWLSGSEFSDGVRHYVSTSSESSDRPPKERRNSKRKKPRDLSRGGFTFCKRDKDGFWQIFTSDLEGKHIRQLTKSPIDKLYPSWSNDGKGIAYVNNLGELWIMDDDGRNNRKIPLPINSSEPKFSPDGKKIIFTSPEDVYHGSTKVWEVDLDTLQLKKLVNRPWLQYNPNYSPDGAQVIFTDGPELFGQNILKLDLKTGDITQITDNGPYDYDMQASFLSSGQEILYSTNESGDYEIYKMDKFGRDKINLSRSPGSYDIMPRASKGGFKIFFLSDRSGSLQIWRMNMDGSQPQQITQGKSGIDSFSVWTG